MDHYRKVFNEILSNFSFSDVDIKWINLITYDIKLTTEFLIHLSPITDTGKLSFTFRKQFIDTVKNGDHHTLLSIITNGNYWPELSTNKLSGDSKRSLRSPANKAEPPLSNDEISSLTTRKKQEIKLLNDILATKPKFHIFPIKHTGEFTPPTIDKILWLEKHKSNYSEIEIIDNNYIGFESVLKMGVHKKLNKTLNNKYNTEIKLYHHHLNP